ncbi:CRISPR-associated protein Csx3 [Planktothrix sp.]
MEVKVTVNGSITLLEIMKDGKAVNPQNPVSHEELAEMLNDLDISGGELVFLSGMPAWAISALALRVKNLFSAVAQYDPRIGGTGGCLVIHSTNPKYKVGQILPLA